MAEFIRRGEDLSQIRAGQAAAPRHAKSRHGQAHTRWRRQAEDPEGKSCVGLRLRREPGLSRRALCLLSRSSFPTDAELAAPDASFLLAKMESDSLMKANATVAQGAGQSGVQAEVRGLCECPAIGTPGLGSGKRERV